MKRKACLIFATFVLLLSLNTVPAFAADTPPQPAQEEIKKIDLTDAQKNELKQLYNKKIEIEKQITQKYADYGVLTTEQANNRIKRMDDMLKKIEQDGFVPKHPAGKRGGLKKQNPQTE